MRKSKEDIDIWNKCILAFFVAVQNESIVASNFFLKQFELLRSIVN